MSNIHAGEAVICIDNSSHPQWAEWYGDEAYAEDMLMLGRRYVVRETSERDGQAGLDVGVPTPWGDPFWNASRFRKALLREPSKAPAATAIERADHISTARAEGEGK